jgi:hypothetical protein
MRCRVLLWLTVVAGGIALGGCSSGGGGSTHGTPDGGSSSGGSSSGGSSSGEEAGGDAGAGCSVCDKAQTCCVAMMDDASTCANFSSSTCELAPSASDQTAYIATCEMQLQSGKGVPACM